MSRSVLLAALTVGAMLGGPAAAQSPDWRLCASTQAREADLAIAACTRLVAASTLGAGERATVHHNRGTLYLKKGAADRAIQDFDEALKLNPASPATLNNRGLAYSAKGETDRALQDFDAAIRRDAKNAAAFFNRASAYRVKGDLDGAIRDLGQALRLDPGDAAALVARGLALAAKGDYDAAIKDHGAAIRLDPHNVAALNHRADAHGHKGDFDRALGDYGAAIGLNPRYALAFRNRARVYFYRGDFAAAAADFAAAEAIDPGSSYALIWRYIAEARSGTIDRAGLHRAAPALREGWPKPLVLHLLGRLDADAVLAAANAPSDDRMRQEQACEAHFFIGQQHVLAGAEDAAIASLRRALALCPRHVVEYHATRVELRRIGAPP